MRNWEIHFANDVTLFELDLELRHMTIIVFLDVSMIFLDVFSTNFWKSLFSIVYLANRK